MRKHQARGHTVPVNRQQEIEHVNIYPQHCVLENYSSTKKVRVVFDAAHDQHQMGNLSAWWFDLKLKKIL